MILVVDNYDSFTYNLVQYFGDLGQEITVLRNDVASVGRVRELAPEGIVIGPGPGTPDESGETCNLIRELSGEIPMLGVCLGHQAIGQVFGGRIIRAPKLMHGKTSNIQHDGRGVFAGLPNPFTATRYHSLIVEEASMPACLDVTARSEDGLIMGLQHRGRPLHGVQFHPESILTLEGRALLRNFISLLGAPA